MSPPLSKPKSTTTAKRTDATMEEEAIEANVRDMEAAAADADATNYHLSTAVGRMETVSTIEQNAKQRRKATFLTVQPTPANMQNGSTHNCH